ncbi:TolC family protein, partial [bacterium]|nr:TolC family protein [bacterium]
QAEREIIYEIRDFLRYERRLTVDISKKYLDILMLKKNIQIYWENYQVLKRIRERNENLAMAGRLSPVYVDMAKQDEFSAYQKWISAVNDYRNAIDEFKVFLGLPPEKKIEVDDKIIKKILTEGVKKFDINLKEGIASALKKRLDLLTYYDEIYDAERKVKVAINNLKGIINLNASVESSTEEKSKPDFNFQKPSYNVGIEFEFPVDKLYERNEYKKKLIELERAERNFEEKKDEIMLEVIENYRNLEEAYESYLIQKSSLSLAEKRVESTDLLFQAGRGTTRDLLEAQEAYLKAETSLTSASINYIKTYLDYLLSCEMIEVGMEKIWKGEKYEEIFGKID